MASSFLKRLEALERSITFRRSRMIVYEAHADTAESEHEALLQEIAASDADLMVCVSKFGPDPVPPRVVSINPI